MNKNRDRAGRRLSLITIDQAIGGGSNVLIAVLAARLLGVESFGLFAIAFLVFISAQGVIRALVCEPLLIRPAEAEERPGEAIGTALLLGFGMGLVVFIAGLGAWLWDDRLGAALVVTAVFFPLLTLQDLGRYLGFATHRPSYALTLDVLRLTLLVVSAGFLVVGEIRNLAGFIAAWACSGAVAGLLLFWQYRNDRIRFGRSWLRETWRFSWRYLMSFAFTQGGALTATVALAVIAGAEALAGVRGALLLLSVATTLQIGSGAAGVTDISRLNSNSAVRSRAIRISGLTAAISVINGFFLLLLPDSWGRLVLGDSWPVAVPLLVPVIIFVALQGALLGARAGLLGTRAVRTTMAVDLGFTPILVGAAVVGAQLGGGIGYCWSVAAALAIVACLWWVLLWLHLGSAKESLGTTTTQGERK